MTHPVEPVNAGNESHVQRCLAQRIENLADAFLGRERRRNPDVVNGLPNGTGERILTGLAFGV